jgi:hypothetical protein
MPSYQDFVEEKRIMGGLSPDPWKHRSSEMSCGMCMYYVEKDLSPGPNRPQPRGPLGRCRRHAPTLSGYPAVFGSDWCGDHKLNEEKAR